MSVSITNEHDNYFSAGLDAYIPSSSSTRALETTENAGVSISYDFSAYNDAAANSEQNACIPIRRNDLGLTYDKGILIPYTYASSAYLYNFYPRISVTATAAYKIKVTARIKILKASYDDSPVSMTVSVGLAEGSITPLVTAVDNSFLVHSDEGWVDLTIIGICIAGTGIINFKLGQFDSNPDCLLLCDNWNAEIFDE